MGFEEGKALVLGYGISNRQGFQSKVLAMQRERLHASNHLQKTGQESPRSLIVVNETKLLYLISDQCVRE